MSGATWERLSFFESTDFVADAYKTRHHESLPASKAHEITSHLRQGREYFQSAAGAGDLVQPLLLYYGSLSLARGLILFLNPDKTESNLTSGHGLGTKAWEATLTGGLTQIPNLTISVGEGTFSELATATSNTERFRIFLAPYPRKRGLKTKGTETLSSGMTVTIREVLARLPELSRHFQRTFKEFPECFPAFVMMLSPETQTDVDVLDLYGNLPDDARIRASLGLPPDLVLARRGEHPLVGPIPNVGFRLLHKSLDEFFEKSPPIVNDRDETIFLVARLQVGLRLSSLSYHMLIAYAMGMIVRYYPSQWSRLVTGGRGDYALPILRASVSLVETNLPRLILLDLEDPTTWQQDDS
jgi:hypothetical protein